MGYGMLHCRTALIKACGVWHTTIRFSTDVRKKRTNKNKLNHVTFMACHALSNHRHIEKQRTAYMWRDHETHFTLNKR